MHNPSSRSDDLIKPLKLTPSEADLFVYCSECGKKKVHEIIFSNYENIDNIEEAFTGGAMITFKCKECNESRKSYVLR